MLSNWKSVPRHSKFVWYLATPESCCIGKNRKTGQEVILSPPVPLAWGFAGGQAWWGLCLWSGRGEHVWDALGWSEKAPGAFQVILCGRVPQERRAGSSHLAWIQLGDWDLEHLEPKCFTNLYYLLSLKPIEKQTNIPERNWSRIMQPGFCRFAIASFCWCKRFPFWVFFQKEIGKERALWIESLFASVSFCRLRFLLSLKETNRKAKHDRETYHNYSNNCQGNQ